MLEKTSKVSHVSTFCFSQTGSAKSGMNVRLIGQTAAQMLLQVHRFMWRKRVPRETRLHTIGSVRTNALAEKQGPNDLGQLLAITPKHKAWNKGRIIGQK